MIYYIFHFYFISLGKTETYLWERFGLRWQYCCSKLSTHFSSIPFLVRIFIYLLFCFLIDNYLNRHNWHYYDHGNFPKPLLQMTMAELHCYSPTEVRFFLFFSTFVAIYCSYSDRRWLCAKCAGEFVTRFADETSWRDCISSQTDLRLSRSGCWPLSLLVFHPSHALRPHRSPPKTLQLCASGRTISPFVWIHAACLQTVCSFLFDSGMD